MINSSGVYRIVVDRGDKPSKYYVGQAASFRKRRESHFATLRRGNHKNRLLQRAFVKYGETAFSFEIMIICEKRKEILDLYEQSLLDSHTGEEVYNLSRLCVGSRLGVITSDATKAKMSAAALGKKRSAETRKRISLAKKGWVPSPEQIERLRKAITGRQQSPEHIKKVADAKRGTKKSAEELARRQATRRANSEARGYWCSPEWKSKQSARQDLRERHLHNGRDQRRA